MFYKTSTAFWMTIVFKFLSVILHQHFITCYSCNDIYFETVNFQFCHERCSECSLLYSCMQCKNTPSGSSCLSICNESCDMIFIPNGTVLRHCYRRDDDCCISCPPYSICSACGQIANVPCLRCKNNMYGRSTDCDQQCGHCLPNKVNEIACDIETGHCPDDCLDGFYGQRCETKCNPKCFDSQTNSTKCARDTGKCTFGCIAGRYSETCQSMCSKNCLDTYCDQTDGTCKECLLGWHGVTCESKCSEMCANRVCDQTTGVCLKGCIPGRYGNHCEMVCSQTCVNDTCNQISGLCEDGCLNDWFGEKCEKRCNKMCLNRTCKQNSGQCENGCLPGSYGNYCYKECSRTCSKKTCDRNNGECLHGCATGWFGLLCNESCSESCVDISCHQTTGVCDRGCIEGFYGEHCEKNCSQGLYGETCKNYTVPCLSCETNFGNDTIETKKSNEISEKSSKSSVENLVLFVLVGVIIALLCIILIYIIRRRNHSHEEITVMSKLNVREEVIYDVIENIIDTASGETYTTDLNSISSHLLKEHLTDKRLEENLAENTDEILLGGGTIYSEVYDEPNCIRLAHSKDTPCHSQRDYETPISKSQNTFDLMCMSNIVADENNIEDSSQLKSEQMSYHCYYNEIDPHSEIHFKDVTNHIEESSTLSTEEIERPNSVMYIHAVN